MTPFLDIVFQSGEFINPDNSWFTDLLITIVGSAIGAGATMWALYQTFKHDRQKENERRLQLQREKVKYFRSLILNSIKEIRQQTEGLLTFNKKIEEQPVLLPRLPQSAQNDILRLVHRINQEEYFHAYLGEFVESDEVITEFRKIYGYLDYFDGQIKLIHDGLRRSVDFDHERKLRLRKLVEDIQDNAAGVLINPTFSENKEMLQVIDSILKDYHSNKTEESDITYAHEKFVVPMKKGLINHAKSAPEIFSLLTDLRKATYLYTDIKMQIAFVGKDFKDDHDTLVKHLGDFELLTQRLKNFTDNKNS